MDHVMLYADQENKFQSGWLNERCIGEFLICKQEDPGSTSDYGAMLAMAVVSLIPILIIFFIFQKQLVEGIATSGLKG